MAQPLEIEPWPLSFPPEEELSISAERMTLINHLHIADSVWAQAQKDPTASLGQKATAAVLLQEAQIRLAAYNDFHPE